MKIACFFAGVMLPDYWGGHHLPHVSIPVWPEMTLDQIRGAIRSELDLGAVMGVEYDLDDQEWYVAALRSVTALQAGSDTPLAEIPMDEEESHAFFVFAEEEPS